MRLLIGSKDDFISTYQHSFAANPKDIQLVNGLCLIYDLHLIEQKYLSLFFNLQERYLDQYPQLQIDLHSKYILPMPYMLGQIVIDSTIDNANDTKHIVGPSTASNTSLTNDTSMTAHANVNFQYWLSVHKIARAINSNLLTPAQGYQLLHVIPE